MHARVSNRGRLLIVGFVAVVVIISLVYAHPILMAHRNLAWVPVWSNNFSGPAGHPIGAAWRYQTGYGVFGNGSVEEMTSSPSNVHLDGHGDLDITALRQGSTWTSARIQTRQTFTPPAGGELKVIATLKQPDPQNGLGYWPAFWMLGQGTWPAHGEIDILEDVNGLSEHSAALHCGNMTDANPDGTFGPCHEHNGRSSGMQACAGCQSGYHTYSVIVDRRNPANEQIRWYLDQHQFFQVSERQVGTAAWNKAVNHGYSIIFDLAIGGSFPDGQCHCITPAVQSSPEGTLRVRRVAVYSTDLG